MGNDLYNDAHTKVAVEQNEQNNSHGCGFTEPRLRFDEAAHEMITISRLNETIDTRPDSGSGVETQLKVDLAIRPVAWNHNVGAVWTVDEWDSAHWSEAVWKRNQSDSYGGYDEVWEVEMVEQSPSTTIKFWYALYVENSQGVRIWDNNNGWNYENIAA